MNVNEIKGPITLLFFWLGDRLKLMAQQIV